MRRATIDTRAMGIAGLVLASATCFAMTGCTLVNDAPAAPTGATISGVVYGGQQAIDGATIQLYAAGSTGYGSAYPYSAGTSLLGTNVVKTVAGVFSIKNDFTCPTVATTPVYLVATGGNPGLSSGTNPNAAVMAALGPCNGINSNTHVVLNELSTVASVWALSGFMTGVANVGTSPGNGTGLANAFATVNTLADILAACVNSAGAAAVPGGACALLFADTTVNGVVPTDTITAAMNMAQHPNQKVGQLLNLVGTNAPFQPVLPTTPAPTDLSLVVTYTGGGLATPSGIAADTNGNIWTANHGNSSVTELANNGAPQSGASGYTVGSVNVPTAIALDASGSAWVANGNSTVTKVAVQGASGTLFTGGSLNLPSSVAVDGSGNVWVSNSGGNSVTQISGTTLTKYTGAGISAPASIAVNAK